MHKYIYTNISVNNTLISIFIEFAAFTLRQRLYKQGRPYSGYEAISFLTKKREISTKIHKLL